VLVPAGCPSAAAGITWPLLTVRQLATGLASNRILFGLGFVLVPAKAARSWIGPVAGRPGGEVMVRAAGARDLALGVGALSALRSGADARPWFAAHLASDATDFAATWAARRDLGPGRSAYALFMAGASTAIAAAYLARSGSGSAPDPYDQG
jgi:hypothetical protein